jgi:hypothetical protein
MDWDPDDCPDCVSASRVLPLDSEFRPVDVVLTGRSPFRVISDVDCEPLEDAA